MNFLIGALAGIGFIIIHTQYGLATATAAFIFWFVFLLEKYG